MVLLLERHRHNLLSGEFDDIQILREQLDAISEISILVDDRGGALL